MKPFITTISLLFAGLVAAHLWWWLAMRQPCRGPLKDKS
ncbi:MAG: hypothetical protein BMS9Abin28_0659 [Anaerolineae bacterium]|nr:MAG: hypothetical protein BMS9Abin28_0659 [Anaerolineae bacterium]